MYEKNRFVIISKSLSMIFLLLLCRSYVFRFDADEYWIILLHSFLLLVLPLRFVIITKGQNGVNTWKLANRIFVIEKMLLTNCRWNRLSVIITDHNRSRSQCTSINEKFAYENSIELCTGSIRFCSHLCLHPICCLVVCDWKLKHHCGALFLEKNYYSHLLDCYHRYPWIHGCRLAWS